MANNNYLASLLNIKLGETTFIGRFPARFVEKFGVLVACIDPDEPFKNGIEFSRQYSRTMVRAESLTLGLWVNNLKVTNFVLNDGDTVRVNAVEYFYQENTLLIKEASSRGTIDQVEKVESSRHQKVALNLFLMTLVFAVTSLVMVLVFTVLQQDWLTGDESELATQVEAQKKKDEAQDSTAFFVPDQKAANRKAAAEEVLDAALAAKARKAEESSLPPQSEDMTENVSAAAEIESTFNAISIDESVPVTKTQPVEVTRQIVPEFNPEETGSKLEKSPPLIAPDKPSTASQVSVENASPFMKDQNSFLQEKPISKKQESIDELELDQAQRARVLVRNFDDKYLAGEGKRIISEAKELVQEAAVSSADKTRLREKIEMFGDLVSQYERGNKLYRSGNKDAAFKAWLNFLKEEKNVLGESSSKYALEVKGIAVEALLVRAEKLEEHEQHLEAFSLREAAAKVEDSESGIAHKMVKKTVGRAEKLMSLAEDNEDLNIQSAKKYWQEVLEILPQEHALAQKAQSKLAWYQYQQPNAGAPSFIPPKSQK